MALALLDATINTVKVRIRCTPRESEIDGVNLTTLTPGSVTDVSVSIGSWLIAEGYALPEMRASTEVGYYSIDTPRDKSADRTVRGHRRRHTDR